MDQKNRKIAIIFGVAVIAVIVIVVIVMVVASLPKGEDNDIDRPFDIALTFGDDPVTQKNFSWYTEKESESVVQYYESSEKAGSAFDPGKAVTVKGFTENFDTYYPENEAADSASPRLSTVTLYRHGVYVNGLKPDTAYLYRVGDGKNWSDSYTFKTAPSGSLSDGGFSFLIVEDMQGFTKSDYSLWGNVGRRALEQCPDASFMVNLGDFTENQDNALLWKYYFTLAPGLQNITTVPVAGNKDDETFLKYFLLGTQEGVTGLNGYYSFNYKNVHFSVLNTGDGNKDLAKSQVKWLTRDLSSDEAQSAAYRIVLVHKAPYSDHNHADDSEIVEIRGQLLPLFEEYGVDVVLEGHDHFYFRSKPVTEGGSRALEYVISEKDLKGDKVSVYSPADSAEGSGVFYFMPGASGVKQHSKGFRDMPEILAERSELMENPTFCVCDTDEDGIYFRTYTVDRYNYSVKLFESWGIGK